MKNSKLHWFKFYPDDFLAGVGRMTAADVGAYTLLLVEAWKSGGIPADPETCAIIARLDLPAFERAWRRSLRDKFDPHPDNPDLLVNPKLEVVRHESARQYETRRARNARYRETSQGASPETSQEGGTQNSELRTTPNGVEGGADAPLWQQVYAEEHIHPMCPELAAAWERWTAYRRESKLKAWARRTVKSQMAKAMQDVPAWIAAVDHSIAQGYQGLFFPRAQAPERVSFQEQDRRRQDAHLREFLEMTSGEGQVPGERLTGGLAESETRRIEE